MVTAPRDTLAQSATQSPVKLGVRDLRIGYSGKTVLEDVSFDIHEHEIFGIIGPANAGKTSFLKAVNRMDLFNPEMSVDGNITFKGVDINKVRNVYGLRRRIGVVFPLPVGLSINTECAARWVCPLLSVYCPSNMRRALSAIRSW